MDLCPPESLFWCLSPSHHLSLSPSVSPSLSSAVSVPVSLLSTLTLKISLCFLLLPLFVSFSVLVSVSLFAHFLLSFCFLGSLSEFLFLCVSVYLSPICLLVCLCLSVSLSLCAFFSASISISFGLCPCLFGFAPPHGSFFILPDSACLSYLRVYFSVPVSLSLSSCLCISPTLSVALSPIFDSCMSVSYLCIYLFDSLSLYISVSIDIDI